MVEKALRQMPAAVGLKHAGPGAGRTLSQFLEARFGATRKVGQCQRLFRQLGFRLRKPRPLLAHADAEEQRAVKKLGRLAADPAVDLWARDEAHFQQYGSRARMWGPPEIRDPVVIHHPTRKSAGYFGAVRLRAGKWGTARAATMLDAQTTWNFYPLLRRSAATCDRRVVVILDNGALSPRAPAARRAPGLRRELGAVRSAGLAPGTQSDRAPMQAPSSPRPPQPVFR